MGERALDVFDGDTAVKDVVVPREALRTGAIDRLEPLAQAEPVPEIQTDKIARARGMPPVAEPYVREARRSRGWLVASLAVTLLSLGAGGAAIVWARGEVESARAEADVARAAQLVAPAVTPPAAMPAATEVAAAPAPECAPPTTELTIESRPAGATVTLDGRELGKTPLVTTVNRYQAGTVWLRAPGRTAERRKIMPTEAHKKLKVTLDRRS